MTAGERVRRVQRMLQGVTIAAALLWGGTVVLALQMVHRLVTRSGGGSDAAALAVSLVLGGCTAAFVVWRARGAFSARRVALWIEEHVPTLQYALVTASDPMLPEPVPALDAVVRATKFGPAITRPVLRGPLLALCALVFTSIVATLSTTSTRRHALILGARTLSDAGAHTSIPNRLMGLHARVVDPAYAGSTTRVLDDPATVTALPGSVVTLTGQGGVIGIGARLGARTASVAGDRDSWYVAVGVPRTPVALTLRDRRFTRTIAIIPATDQPPSVVLSQPARDSVWRTVPPELQLVARARDDIGLGAGHFEFTITTGSGEVFKARTGTVGETPMTGTSATLHATWSPAALGLVPGDVVSVRAVVQDRNSVTGPGTAASDTRTFRVARPGEFDSLAVEGAPPPPVQQSLLTERMLIISAESLLKARPRTVPAQFTAAAARIGTDQADLRKRVYGILYGQDEAGGTKGVEGDDEELDPQVVVNRDLRAAYDAMWDAERSLNVAEIPQALGPMHRALAALDRARLVNRRYLRGGAPRVVVNVEKVRLTGKEKGNASVSAPRPVLDTTKFARALADAVVHRSDEGTFGQAITRLQVAAAATHPAFAAALGAVTDSLRRHGNVSAALAVARRTLEGAPRLSGMVRWGGAWPGTGTP